MIYRHETQRVTHIHANTQKKEKSQKIKNYPEVVYIEILRFFTIS